MNDILPELGISEAEYLALYPDAEVLGMSALEHFRIFGHRRTSHKRAQSAVGGHTTSSTHGETVVGALNVDDARGGARIDRIDAAPSNGVADGAVAGSSSDFATFEFDPAFYLSQNEDVRAAGLDPRWHYFDSGWREPRNPHPEFSVAFYLRQYPDVAEAGIEPFGHFIRDGVAEGRYPNFREYHKARSTRALEDRTPLFLLSRTRVSGETGASKTSLAVHVHCYFEDVFATSVLDILRKLPAGFALFVSVTSAGAADRVRKLLAGLTLGELDIRVVENRGRDLAPLFVDFFEAIQKYDVCLHLHTKKSVEKQDFGTRWLSDLGLKLFSSSPFIQNTIRLFETDPSIGMIGPKPYGPIRRFMGWGANHEAASNLVRKLGSSIALPPPGSILDFPAGSFFWFRPSAFGEMHRLGLTTRSFPAEPIPDDGTVAHALERVLPMIVAARRHRYVEVAPLPYESEHPAGHPVAVSIIIPAFNAAQFIEQAVLSVARQTCFHVKTEIIVVDNASTDATADVLSRLSAVVPNLRVFSETTKGAGAARNKGLAEARGKYVTFLDADDILLEDAIGDLYDAILASPDHQADFATSSLRMFSADWLSASMPYDDDGRIETLDLTAMAGDESIWAAMASDFGSCTKLYRREFLDELNIRYPEGVNFEDNYFIGCVMMESKAATILRSVTYLYRKSEDGMTQSTKRSPEIIADQIRVIEMLLERFDGKSDRPRWNTYKKALLDKLKHEANRVGVPLREALTPQQAPRTYRAYFNKTAGA